MERSQTSDKFPIGSKLPNFELINVDGNKINNSYLGGAKASLVVFSCNHCPYVKGSEAQLVHLVHEFKPLGLKAIAISSNDAVQYPEDNYENMKRKSEDLKLPYPYLYDESQEVAHLFDAACTPECYLFDENHNLVFHGTINDNPKDPKAATKGYLSKAIEQLLEGEKPQPAFVHPLGCSIKWKK